MNAGASLILLAPCCHRELRPRLNAPDSLRGLARAGIHADRLAEMVTDSLRALLLETHGYRVTVAEWVGAEHTPRNTLIAGVRTGNVRPGAPVELAALRDFFGLTGTRW